MEVKTLEFKNNIGNMLQLQFSPQPNQDERFYVKLIGFLENKSFIVTTPRFDGVPLKIIPSQKFIVRMMSKSKAQVFTTSAIHSTSHPYPHIHLAYPEKFDSITIRKAERVHCKLNVSVHNEDPLNPTSRHNTALMHDISTAGALLYATEELGNIGDTISIETTITVAGMDQELFFSAKIRRMVPPDKGRDTYEYGIEFTMLEDKTKLLLHAFVYEQIAHE